MILDDGGIFPIHCPSLTSSSFFGFISTIALQNKNDVDKTFRKINSILPVTIIGFAFPTFALFNFFINYVVWEMVAYFIVALLISFLGLIFSREINEIIFKVNGKENKTSKVPIDFKFSSWLLAILLFIGVTFLIFNFSFYTPKYDIKYSDSGEDATMIKRVYDIRGLIDDKIIVAYGDTYAYINFNELLSSHNSSDALMTIVATSIKSPFGLIETKENKKITSFREKPILNYYMGYSLFFKKLIEIGKMNAYIDDKLVITFNTQSQRKMSNNIFQYYTDWKPENEE